MKDHSHILEFWLNVVWKPDIWQNKLDLKNIKSALDNHHMEASVNDFFPRKTNLTNEIMLAPRGSF